MPLTDVRVELLRPSDTVTECPYKVGFPHSFDYLIMLD